MIVNFVAAWPRRARHAAIWLLILLVLLAVSEAPVPSYLVLERIPAAGASPAAEGGVQAAL